MREGQTDRLTDTKGGGKEEENERNRQTDRQTDRQTESLKVKT